MNDDAELLRRYAEDQADDAFAELVRRHVDFVYSAALRQLNGDAHLAADATQLVFADLARKAPSLVRHRVLAGWLFTSTRFATAKLVRSERRRQAREQEAQLMHELSHDDSASLDWQRLRPVLDEALGELSPADREAILLRYFEGRDYATIGARLALAGNTARMRVERALEKLRAHLARRGVTSTSAALATALADQAVVAAPAGLAAAVTGAALAGGGVGTGAVAASGAVAGFMSMGKLQVGISGALAVAGVTGFMVQSTANSRLQEEIGALRRANAEVASLQEQNRQLARVAVEVEEMRTDDAQFARLDQEAGALRNRLQQLAKSEQARAAAARQAAGQVFDLGAVDQRPAPRFQRPPEFPAALRQAGISGEAVVDFVVDAAGNVTNAFAIRSSHKEFEAAAVDAVSAWKFTAGRKEGRDVATHLQVPIVFTLPNDAGSRRAPPSESGAKETESFVVQDKAGEASAAGKAAPTAARPGP